MIILTGEAGVGKDTYADRLTAAAADDGISVHRITFARVLKDMAEKLGWNGRKDEKGRTLLQELGKLVKEYHGHEFFAEKAFEGVEPQEGKENLFIVTDLRFLSEYYYVLTWAKQRNISCTVVRIDRDRDKNWTSSLTEEQKKDVSENNWKTIDPDILVHNDGVNFYCTDIDGAPVIWDTRRTW